MKALHLKILLSYCFSTFFPLHKLQLCLFMILLGPPFIPNPAYYPSRNFPTPFLLRPPIYSGPKSISSFLKVLKVLKVS